MRPSNILAIFPLAAFAALNGPCTGAPDGTATGLWLSEGVCVTDCVDSRGAAGKTISGGCPFDPDDVLCCLVGLETSLGNKSPDSFTGGDMILAGSPSHASIFIPEKIETLMPGL
jgi:hypothetical protein